MNIAQLKPGKHTYTFLGECTYEDSVYLFPINRTLEVTGPAEPKLLTIEGSWRWQSDMESSGNAYFTALTGSIGNYQPGYTVGLLVNGTQLPNITVNSNSTFALTNLEGYAFPFSKTNIPLQITFTDSLGNKNWTDTIIAVGNLTGTKDVILQRDDILTAYPNPFTNELTVTNLQPNTKLVLYTLDGGKAMATTTQKSSSAIMNTTGLPKGIYLLQIATPTGLLKQMKVIKE